MPLLSRQLVGHQSLLIILGTALVPSPIGNNMVLLLIYSHKNLKSAGAGLNTLHILSLWR